MAFGSDGSSTDEIEVHWTVVETGHFATTKVMVGGGG